jgi:hypothetical protein
MRNIFKQKLFLPLITLALLWSQTSFATEALTAKSEFVKFEPSKFSKNNEIVVEVWNSEEGIKRLENSKYKNDFYELANFFQPQINPLYCGVATSVMILNAFGTRNDDIESQANLEVLTPSSMGGGIIPFKAYSQLTFLNEKTDKIKNRKVIELNNVEEDEDKIDPGLNLDQLAAMLDQVYKLKVKTTHVTKVDDSDLEKFRWLLKTTFNDKNHYLIANFNGRALGLKSDGHISPIVAFDQDSDSVLVLDVASHKRPWYWVKAEHLYKAMNTLDDKKYRGYLIVSQR